MYLVTSDYLAYDLLFVNYDFCLAIKTLVFTLYIWVPPSPSHHVTIAAVEHTKTETHVKPLSQQLCCPDYGGGVYKALQFLHCEIKV